MSGNLWVVTSLLIRQGFGFSLKGKKAKKAKKSKKEIRTLVGFVLLFAVFFPQIFVFYETNMKMFELGLVSGALENTMAISCFLCILLTLLTFATDFYFSQDLPVLLTLPLRPREIILAKTIVICLRQLPFILGCTIPLWAAAIMSGLFSPLQIFIIIIESLIVPLEALLIMGILTILVMQFLPFVKNKDRYNLFVGIAGGIAGASIGIFSAVSSNSSSASVLSSLPTGGASRVFVQMIPAIQSILDSNLLLFAFTLLVAIAVWFVYGWAADRFYLKAALSSSSSTPKKVKTAKDTVQYSAFRMMVDAERKKLLRTPAYLTNNILGMFIMPVVLGGMMFFLPGELKEILAEFHLADALASIGINPLGLGLATGLLAGLLVGDGNMISATTISREGVNGVNWMKKIPVSMQQQLDAKLTVGITASWISTSLLLIPMVLVLRPSVGMILTYLLGSLIGCILVNQLALIVDVWFPKLNWDTELASVKSNFFPVLVFWGSMVLCGVSVFVLIEFSSSPSVFNFLCVLYVVVVAVLCGLLWRVPAKVFWYRRKK